MDGRPYLSLNRFLRDQFGERVQKIPLDAGLGCPNRNPDGSGGCIFCDSRGSGTGAAAARDIRNQMLAGMKWGVRRYRAYRYMAYFQSWTNTFAPAARLKTIYKDALIDDTVVGLAIGTRPDCIDHKCLDAIAEAADGRMVWIEYGFQSASDRSLEWLGRRHTVDDFLNALEITREYDFLVCAHVIFGIKGETGKDMEKTIEFLDQCGVEGVKFHQLYAIRGTRLHDMYEAGDFIPISLDDYAGMVAWSIRRLDSGTVIHRLAGDPPLGELVAPAWSSDKRRVIDSIHQRLGYCQACQKADDTDADMPQYAKKGKEGLK